MGTLATYRQLSGPQPSPSPGTPWVLPPGTRPWSEGLDTPLVIFNLVSSPCTGVSARRKSVHNKPSSRSTRMPGFLESRLWTLLPFSRETPNGNCTCCNRQQNILCETPFERNGSTFY